MFCPHIWVILATISWTSAFQHVDFEAAVRESDIEGLVGDSVRLPCEVDKANCGKFHSIKWYKGNDRVFIFSEMAQVKRAEGGLLERTEFHYSEDRKENWLEIEHLKTDDEGTYKCEITYLTVEEACSVVQFVNLKTLASPRSLELMFEDGTLIRNGTKIGPIPEGDDVALKCQAGRAKPMPSVKWFNGTQKINGRFKSTVDGGGLVGGSSTIHLNPSRHDLGRNLTCLIHNEAMESPATLSLQIDVDFAPESVAIETDRLVVEEGEEVTLVCRAKGAKPVATISWRNGTTPVEKAHTDVNIKSNGLFETESNLTFRSTRFESQVPFSCEATNAILERRGEAPISQNISIDVQYAPTVTVRPENNTLNESMDLLLFCDYTANPIQLTHVYWYLDGHQLDVAGRPQKYGNGNVDHASLLIANASAEDAGSYTCRVANAVGASLVTNHAHVNVQYRPEVAVVTEPEGPVSEDVRPNVTLVCDVVRAHPQTLTKVRWFLDDELLKIQFVLAKDCECQNVFWGKNEQSNAQNSTLDELPECSGDNSTGLYDRESELCNVDPSRLFLEDVNREFHGNYSCEGMNGAGWGHRSAPAPVVVHYRPRMTVIEYQPEMVIKGHPVTLTCNAVEPGRPIATTFLWTRNGLRVQDMTHRVWKIDSASLETKANFTCLAINSEGEGSLAFASVNVLAQPTFITRLQTYHGALLNADDVRLTCHVECSPNCSLSWLKDNRPLDNRTHYNVTNIYLPAYSYSGDFESVKSILSWRMPQWPAGRLHREDDNANYTCVSSANAAGDGVSSTTKFRVEYPPERIWISSNLSRVTEAEVPADRIQCSASGYPEPSYHWKHGDQTVVAGAILSLDFPARRRQAGSYTCIAENRHGHQTAATLLDVLFKPECKIDREDSSLGEPATIRLICRAYANPDQVDFRWRLGNETLVDWIKSSGQESELTLDAVPSSLGTYYCYVNNSVGESIPCEIDVTGLLETLGDDNILIYAIIAVALLVLIIIIVLIIIFCRRQRQRGKSSDSTKRDSALKPTEASRKDPSNGTKDNRPNSPYEEGPTFYENLPFHGIQAPPNKPLLTGGGTDMEYADVDYATYNYGPIPYKAESVVAVKELRAEKEAENTGVPVRPPRKK